MRVPDRNRAAGGRGGKMQMKLLGNLIERWKARSRLSRCHGCRRREAFDPEKRVELGTQEFSLCRGCYETLLARISEVVIDIPDLKRRGLLDAKADRPHWDDTDTMSQMRKGIRVFWQQG
jgi:hypothetical protein